MTYAVFGDSYVTRLDRYLSGRLGFEKNCIFIGVPGMTTKKKFQDAFEKLLSCQPRFVFINLGGNDISAEGSPESVFRDIMRVVDDLYRHGVERVFVASIVMRGKFPPWTGLTEKTFRLLSRSVNKKLKKILVADFVDVGKRLVYPTHYDSDLVHPGRAEGGLKVFQHRILNSFRKTL